VLESAEFEVVEFEEPVMEAIASPFVELPVVEDVPALVEAPVEDSARVDDLRARIEATRRRIRHELEQPFMSTEEAKATEGDWTVAPAVPTAEEAVETVAPTIGDAVESVPAVSEPVELLSTEPEFEVDLGEPPVEPVDYDSMRSRIEVTRSRLKAKAFDAMMTGESALLGRDAEDAAHKRKVVTGVDSEVDETIETSLREEDD
jgi:hypothetical protein